MEETSTKAARDSETDKMEGEAEQSAAGIKERLALGQRHVTNISYGLAFASCSSIKLTASL